MECCAGTKKVVKEKIMSDNKTIGERIDEVAGKMSEKVEIAKDKIAKAKENAADIAHCISKTVKKAAADSSEAVSDMIHNKK
jgi:hypothetical protein